MYIDRFGGLNSSCAKCAQSRSQKCFQFSHTLINVGYLLFITQTITGCTVSSCTRSQEWVVWTVGPLIRLCHTRKSLGNRSLTFTTSILNQLYLIQTNASFMNRLLISSQTQVISTYEINKCIRTFMLTKHCLSNICLEVSLVLEAFFWLFCRLSIGIQVKPVFSSSRLI